MVMRGDASPAPDGGADASRPPVGGGTPRRVDARAPPIPAQITLRTIDGVITEHLELLREHRVGAGSDGRSTFRRVEGRRVDRVDVPRTRRARVSG